MKVENEHTGKTLYHIQNLNMGSDGAGFDAFVWCDHYPNKQDLRKVFDLEWGDGYANVGGEVLLEEWLTSSGVYVVYAEEI